jgi:hypothetical protein
VSTGLATDILSRHSPRRVSVVGGWEFAVPLRDGNVLAGWERIGGAGEAWCDREIFLGLKVVRSSRE